MSTQKVNIQFSVHIDASSALEGVSYNSETEELTVTFSGSSDYTFIEVDVEDALRFIALAVNMDSWGRAWHQWKGRLDLKRKDDVERQYGQTISDMHDQGLSTLQDLIEAEKRRRKQERNREIEQSWLNSRLERLK